jgi:hypothetical protein
MTSAGWLLRVASVSQGHLCWRTYRKKTPVLYRYELGNEGVGSGTAVASLNSEQPQTAYLLERNFPDPHPVEAAPNCSSESTIMFMISSLRVKCENLDPKPKAQRGTCKGRYSFWIHTLSPPPDFELIVRRRMSGC